MGCPLKNSRKGGILYCDTEVWEDPRRNIRLFGIIRRDSPEWKEFYTKRQAVERVFQVAEAVEAARASLPAGPTDDHAARPYGDADLPGYGPGETAGRSKPGHPLGWSSGSPNVFGPSRYPLAADRNKITPNPKPSQ